MRHPRRPWRWIGRHRILSAGLALVILAIAALVATWYLVLRSPGTKVGLGQALRQFRHEQTSGAPSSALLPAPGVYRYAGSGSEAVSLPGIGRSFPGSSYLIVADHGRCATMEWQPLVQHMEGLEVCLGPAGSLVLAASPSYEQIAGVSTTSVLRCPPVAYFLPAEPVTGQRWSAVCHSPGARVALHGSVLGRGVVRVGAREVPAVHTRLVFRFSGSDTGTNPNDFWISTADGLILRQRESVHVSQGAGPLGSIRYTEHMAIALSSLAPATRPG